eukprot:3310977-Amphidinium_carterae.1
MQWRRDGSRRRDGRQSRAASHGGARPSRRHLLPTRIDKTISCRGPREEEIACVQAALEAGEEPWSGAPQKREAPSHAAWSARQVCSAAFRRGLKAWRYRETHLRSSVVRPAWEYGTLATLPTSWPRPGVG